MSMASISVVTLMMHSCAPDDTKPINALLKCILGRKSWTAENFLQVNQDKPEDLITSPENETNLHQNYKILNLHHV